MTGGGTGTSRRGGNQAAVTGRCHRAWNDPWRPFHGGPRPFHRLSRRVARPSLSLSRGRPTAPCKQDPLCLSLRGREPVPGDWAHGPVRGRDPVSRGCEPHGPLRLSPRRGEQEGSSPSQERPCFRRLRTTQAPASLPSQGRTRGVLWRGGSAIPPSVDRSSVCGRTSFSGRSPPQSFRRVRTDADR